MAGSGTALVEAMVSNRAALGIDMDPLAVKQARVKTTPVDIFALQAASDVVLGKAKRLLRQPHLLNRERERRFDEKTREFLDYWFRPTTQDELTSLLMPIQRQAAGKIRESLEVVFSSIIVTKSGGVSMARDLAHSRPHRVQAKRPRSAIQMFQRNARRAVLLNSSLPKNCPKPEVREGDARNLNVPSDSIDLVVTSPPYANAIDYMRAHKFSLVWLGYPIKDLSVRRSTYIGSEKLITTLSDSMWLPNGCLQILQKLAVRDLRRANVLAQYLSDMDACLREIRRVMKKERCAVLVVGPSTMRDLEIPTHECLAELAEVAGLEVVGLKARELDRDRRMMPYRRANLNKSSIENRIAREYVIGLCKN